VTGRNLHAEAGPGKEWEEVVRREECSEKGTEVPFFPLEQESLFWVFKRKKKKWLGGRELEGVRSRASATAEMTIQSQDTAEDCTTVSGELGWSAASAGAGQLAAPECPAPAATSPL
jgi:hypothetical protein